MLTSPLISQQFSVKNAYLEHDTTIVAKLSDPLSFPVKASDLTVTDTSAGKTIPVLKVDSPPDSSAISFGTTLQTPAESAEGDPVTFVSRRIDLIEVTLAEAPDVRHSLYITLKGDALVLVTPRNVLNAGKYVYQGNDLGSIYQPELTSFRLWAPTASDVQLLLYESETGPLQQQVVMLPSDNGTWFARVFGDLQNWYYLYKVTVHGTTRYAVDPYTRAIAANGTRGMIVDLSKTNPQAWSEDGYVDLASPTDAIIYEVHIRDFSIHPTSSMVHKGKYLAFTERGTTGPNQVAAGVDHLKELGITHVQLQPVQAFASVDEDDPNHHYWGYDPRNFNVPTGAYATTPHGIARITECKQMIQSLHNEDIGVILDVVYNHTFTQYDSDFDKIVPQYYYRTDDAGNYTNGSGAGNEMALERPMVEKFFLDSLTYWVSEYHVDGFRFDLMALLGIEAMKKVSEQLHALNPHTLLYGEPWAGGTSSLADNMLLTKGRQKGLGLAMFNDHVRDTLCGSVFDGAARGFATGAWEGIDALKRAVVGSTDDFTAFPQETINYVTSHDNYTLWDKITLSTPGETEADRVKMDELAQAIILTCQGVAFFQGGEEMLRTKGGSSNSFDAGDEANQFDWSRKASYWKVWRYYAALIRLRRNHAAFRMRSVRDIREHLSFLESPENTVMFELAGHANGDRWERILVIYNPNKTDILCPLPPGNWTITVSQDRVSEDYLGRASGRVIVPHISCMVLYR